MDDQPDERGLPADLRCPECDYDLRGIPERRCPECGFRYDREGIISLNRDRHVSRISELKLAAFLQFVGSLIVLLFGIWGAGRSLFLMGGVLYLLLLPLLALLWFFDIVSGAVMPTRPREGWLLGVAGIALVVWVMAAGASKGDAVWALFALPGITYGCSAEYNCRGRLNALSLSLTREVARVRKWRAMSILGLASSVVLVIVLFLS